MPGSTPGATNPVDAGRTGDRSAGSSPPTAKEEPMAVARVSRLISSSKKGFQDAVDNAVSRANKTLRGLTGGEIVSQKVKIERGKIVEYRVEMDIMFILE
jgi:dodecin